MINLKVLISTKLLNKWDINILHYPWRVCCGSLSSLLTVNLKQAASWKEEEVCGSQVWARCSHLGSVLQQVMPGFGLGHLVHCPTGGWQCSSDGFVLLAPLLPQLDTEFWAVPEEHVEPYKPRSATLWELPLYRRCAEQRSDGCSEPGGTRSVGTFAGCPVVRVACSFSSLSLTGELSGGYRLLIASSCLSLVTQFTLQSDWGFKGCSCKISHKYHKRSGSLRPAPVGTSCQARVTSLQCSLDSGFSANLEAVKSLKYQTPVGMEDLELLGLGRRKADYLCWNLTGVNSPPPRKAAVGFLEMQEVTNCDFFFFFSCLIRKAELFMFMLCDAFLGH